MGYDQFFGFDTQQKKILNKELRWTTDELELLSAIASIRSIFLYGDGGGGSSSSGGAGGDGIVIIRWVQ